jgi:hypothetical protein
MDSINKDLEDLNGDTLLNDNEKKRSQSLVHLENNNDRNFQGINMFIFLKYN